jgi:hypothetical protein
MGPTYKPSKFVRHPLTKRNQEELDIAGKVGDVLAWDKRTWRGGNKVLTYVQAQAKENPNNADGTPRLIAPIGFSINKRWYGDAPPEEEKATAHERGWYAYMNMGVPLIDERHDIVQPPPDVISEHTYIDRTDPVLKEVVDTIEFSISNTISWSLTGQVQLTFGAKALHPCKHNCSRAWRTAWRTAWQRVNSKARRRRAHAPTSTTTTKITSAPRTSSSTSRPRRIRRRHRVLPRGPPRRPPRPQAQPRAPGSSRLN